jgi:hypothetical protein
VVRCAYGEKDHQQIDRCRQVKQIAAADLAEARRKSVNGVASHVPVSETVQHPQHTVGGDEGRDAQRCYHQAVEQTDDAAGRKAGEHAEGRRTAVMDHGACEASGQRNVGADREIEAGREHNQRQPRRDEEHQARLPQYIQDVAEAEKRFVQERQHDADYQRGEQPIEYLQDIFRDERARRRKGWLRHIRHDRLRNPSKNNAKITRTPMLAT